MKYIVRTVPPRSVDHIALKIPGLIVVKDRIHNAMETFLRAQLVAGDDSAVHMEDDVVLCENFYERCNAICEEHPNDVIQFFSRRSADLTIGTRYIPGSAFSFNVCYYLPRGMSKEIYDFAQTWTRYDEHPTGYDILMQDYFKKNHIKYLNIVPNIVDHDESTSIINPKRAHRRVSLTFVPYDLRDIGNSKNE